MQKKIANLLGNLELDFIQFLWLLTELMLSQKELGKILHTNGQAMEREAMILPLVSKMKTEQLSTSNLKMKRQVTIQANIK